MRLTSSDGSTTVETDSAREATQLRAQGYTEDGPAKNKARTTKSSSSKARTPAADDAPPTDS